MSQDALSLVREATITGTPVNYVDNHYIFGNYKFHEGTKTCFKRTLNCEHRTHIDNAYFLFHYKPPASTCWYTLNFIIFAAVTDYYYTLRDVVFYLENADSTVAEYRRKVVTMRCTAVVEVDKASLRGYLTGAIESCPQLDFAAAVASAASYNAAVAQETELAAPAVPLISSQEMQEQRQRHAAIFDQSVQIQTQTIRLIST